MESIIKIKLLVLTVGLMLTQTNLCGNGQSSGASQYSGDIAASRPASPMSEDEGYIETKSFPAPAPEAVPLHTLEDITRAKLIDLIKTAPQTDPTTSAQNLLLTVITYVNTSEFPSNALSKACVELAPHDLRLKIANEQVDLAIAHSFGEDYANNYFGQKIESIKADLRETHATFCTTQTPDSQVNLAWNGIRLATALNYKNIFNQCEHDPEILTRDMLARIFHAKGQGAALVATYKGNESNTPSL